MQLPTCNALGSILRTESLFYAQISSVAAVLRMESLFCAQKKEMTGRT
jgi:hypothetical protein